MCKAICSEWFNNLKGSSSYYRLIIHDHRRIKIITPKFYSNPRSKEKTSIDIIMLIAPDFQICLCFQSSMFSVIRIGNHVHVKSSGVGDTCSEMPDPQAMQNLLMPNPRY